MIKISIFLILCLMVVYINAFSYSDVDLPEACGDNVARVLKTICVGRHTRAYGKSSNEDINAHTDLTNNKNTSEFEEYLRFFESTDGIYMEKHSVPSRFPFKARSDASKMYVRFRRQSGGIVEECCNKPCTIDEVREYC